MYIFGNLILKSDYIDSRRTSIIKSIKMIVDLQTYQRSSLIFDDQRSSLVFGDQRSNMIFDVRLILYRVSKQILGKQELLAPTV
jgi:hypothetical protein